MTRIAVVDDDPMLLGLMREIMAERSWHVLPYSQAHTAVEELTRDVPDVIVLDIRLSATISGWDILRRLKSDEATRDIPVIVWSGDPGRLRDKATWLRANSIATLPKPFDIEVLFRTVERALKRSHETMLQNIVS